MFKKRVFTTLALFMVGFGALIGCIFPFFVVATTSVPADKVMSLAFFSMCIVAGILVGVFNFFLAKKIVGSKIRKLSSHMKHIENKLIEKSKTHSFEDCMSEDYYISEISDDELGESAKSFNSLVNALAMAFKSEISVKKFTEMLSSKLDISELAEEALMSLLDTCEAKAGAIIIEREGELEALSVYGFVSTDSVVKNDMVEKIFMRKKRVFIEIPDDLSLSGVVLEFKPRSVLVEPIIYKGVVLGCVVLAGSNRFETETYNNLELFGQGLALALKNAITHDQLQKLAVTDPLTGALNRRYGLTRLKEEFVRSVRSNQPLRIVILDVDFFKKINDTYGHLVGDRVLVSVSEIAKEAMREGDIFLRYGGEEFAAILPGASASDTRMISERIRRYIEDLEVAHNSQKIKVTASLGGASFPEFDAVDYLNLMERADKNLYKAKESGRNMSVIE